MVLENYLKVISKYKTCLLLHQATFIACCENSFVCLNFLKTFLCLQIFLIRPKSASCTGLMQFTNLKFYLRNGILKYTFDRFRWSKFNASVLRYINTHIHQQAQCENALPKRYNKIPSLDQTWNLIVSFGLWVELLLLVDIECYPLIRYLHWPHLEVCLLWVSAKPNIPIEKWNKNAHNKDDK